MSRAEIRVGPRLLGMWLGLPSDFHIDAIGWYSDSDGRPSIHIGLNSDRIPLTAHQDIPELLATIETTGKLEEPITEQSRLIDWRRVKSLKFKDPDIGTPDGSDKMEFMS